MRHITHQSNDVCGGIRFALIINNFYGSENRCEMVSAGFKLLVVAYLICGLTACGTGQVKSIQTLDLSSPGSIQIAIEIDNDSLQLDEVKQQVGKNLADWDYPISALDNKPASHLLSALVGKAEYGSTPAGFSFSVGNSDPRALDFQKANVLPITCRLSPINRPEQSAELNMGFSDSEVIGPTFDIKALTDHISTVCFNLLQEVNWPVDTSESKHQPKATSWMPEIRIETEPEAMPPTNQKSSVAEQNPPALPSAGSGETPKPITKEINKAGRKVYIIHNQGNPIIFKFGHERK